MPEDSSPAIRARSVNARVAMALDRAGMLVVLLALVIIFSLTVENFFSLRNLDGLLLAVSTVGIISCTMLFCLASGNFDLSVGTIVPCAGVCAALVMKALSRGADHSHDGAIATLAILAALGFGGLVGLVNGFIVAVCKINPLITTLATMQIVRGLAFILSGGPSVAIPNECFPVVGNGAFPVIHNADGGILFQMTVPVWICLGCFLFFGFLLRHTVFGRCTLAIGGNEEAARMSGIAVARTKVLIFTIQGVVAAGAGIILASRLYSGQPDVSQGLELQVISACVLGGVSLTGGVGKMSFVVAGVFIMGVVENAMSLKDVPPFWRYVVSGGILLAAVLYDRLKQKLTK